MYNISKQANNKKSKMLLSQSSWEIHLENAFQDNYDYKRNANIKELIEHYLIYNII